MHLQDKNASIYVAGHRGLVGSAVIRRLEAEGYTNLITRTSKELDLRNQQATRAFFASEPNVRGMTEYTADLSQTGYHFRRYSSWGPPEGVLQQSTAWGRPFDDTIL